MKKTKKKERKTHEIWDIIILDSRYWKLESGEHIVDLLFPLDNAYRRYYGILQVEVIDEEINKMWRPTYIAKIVNIECKNYTEANWDYKKQVRIITQEFVPIKENVIWKILRFQT
jgi:hypothetical protein